MRVGIDLENIDRMNEKLLAKICFESEKRWLSNFSDITVKTHMASLWVAKEATIKALGVGDMREVELVHENSKPSILLHGKMLEKFKELNMTEIEISISHTKEQAVCIAIMK